MCWVVGVRKVVWGFLMVPFSPPWMTRNKEGQCFYAVTGAGSTVTRGRKRRPVPTRPVLSLYIARG